MPVGQGSSAAIIHCNHNNRLKRNPDVMVHGYMYICANKDITMYDETLSKYHNGRNSKKCQSMKMFPGLHTTTSWNVHALLEIHWSHGSSFVGAGDEISMIFSKSKDEVWSQYKHLNDAKKLNNAKIDPLCHGSWVLLKWWEPVRCRYHW